MKKVAKLLAVLLPLAIVVTGCQNSANGDVSGGGDDDNGGWVTVWTEITDVDGSIHFHVGGGGEGFIEIQRIFLNTSPSTTGAVTLFNFTATPIHGTLDPEGGVPLFWANITFVEDAGTAEGRFVLDSVGDAWHYGGGFASYLINSNDYIGFVVRTEDAGNARFAFGPAPNHIEVNFSTLLD